MFKIFSRKKDQLPTESESGLLSDTAMTGSPSPVFRSAGRVRPTALPDKSTHPQARLPKSISQTSVELNRAGLTEQVSYSDTGPHRISTISIGSSDSGYDDSPDLSPCQDLDATVIFGNELADSDDEDAEWGAGYKAARCTGQDNQSVASMFHIGIGTLLIFESKSSWGRAMIKISAESESLPMGHVAMVVGRREQSSPDSTHPNDLLLVTAEWEGACIQSLSTALANYREDYASIWVLPLDEPLKTGQASRFLPAARRLTDLTSVYSILGPIGGLVKLKTGVSVPLPKKNKTEGRTTFCSQAVAKVLVDVGMQCEDLFCHEISTASLAYLIDRRGRYLYSDTARHLHDYYPGYFLAADPLTMKPLPSRVCSLPLRVENTVTAATRSKTMKRALDLAYQKRLHLPLQGALSAQDYQLGLLAHMERRDGKTKYRHDCSRHALDGWERRYRMAQ